MELKDGIKTFYAKDRKAWRTWLQKNGDKEKSVWLIIYKKESQTSSVYYNEAVEEALCYAWIDSKANKRNEESFYLFFAQRNPTSNWSKLNKDRVIKLSEQGLMTPKGTAIIEVAKKNGAWTALDTVERLELPADLQAALKQNTEAATHFNNFPRSTKRGILEWIQNAKKEETRASRIRETVSLAEKDIRPLQYKPKS